MPISISICYLCSLVIVIFQYNLLLIDALLDQLRTPEIASDLQMIKLMGVGCAVSHGSEGLDVSYRTVEIMQ